MIVFAAAPYKTNADMIAAVAKLGYLRPTDRVLDPTYGKGVWWKKFRPANLITHDAVVDGIDFLDLPYKDRWFDAVVFDPPYKLNGTPTPEVDDRYGVGTSTKWQERHELIFDGIDALSRLTRRHLFIKCQDQVCSGEVRWQTIEFINYTTQLGFRLQDQLLRLGGRPQPEGRRQIHARRNYSTLLVFKRVGK